MPRARCTRPARTRPPCWPRRWSSVGAGGTTPLSQHLARLTSAAVEPLDQVACRSRRVCRKPTHIGTRKELAAPLPSLPDHSPEDSSCAVSPTKRRLLMAKWRWCYCDVFSFMCSFWVTRPVAQLRQKRIEASCIQASAILAFTGSRFSQLRGYRGPIMHQLARFQHNRIMHRWVIDDSTNFSGSFIFLGGGHRGDMAKWSFHSWVDQTTSIKRLHRTVIGTSNARFNFKICCFLSK